MFIQDPRFRFENCSKIDPNGFFRSKLIIFRKIKIFLNLPKNKTEMRVRYILSICILEYTRVFNQNQKFCGAEIFDQNLESFFDCE